MLVGLDTGYEGKFDFPRWVGAPRITYMLATMPRTGSSWFSHLLWQSGCLGAPLEYLNFEPAGPYAFAANLNAAQLQIWNSLLARRTSPNGIFGLKCFPSQLQALQQSNPELLSAVMATVVRAGDARIVSLQRRDRLAHAISYARAAISGVWRKEQERADPEVAYSQAEVDRARALLDEQTAAWTQMFDELAIEPLELFYEDVVADPNGAMAQVAAYVGADLTRKSQVHVPLVEKQDDSDAKLWTERYLDSVRSARA